MRTRITADSTCDLSPELREKYDIAVAPLTVMLGDEAFHDGVDVTPEQIIAAVEAGKACKTAAVNVYEYEKLFRRTLSDCDAVIHLCIGGKFSACYANACQAAKQVGSVYVINTNSLSTGLGISALRASELAQSGMAPEEIVATVEAELVRVDCSFVLDQVDYLHNGGRCSGVAAAGAKLLKIKPCIEVSDGVMTVGKKYRGSFLRALDHYIADRLAERDRIDFSRVIMTSCQCAPAAVAHVKSQLSDFREILETTACGTVCCHCGPNTFEIVFMKK